MQTSPDTLTLRAEAADEENLQRVQDLLAEHLDRFARRDHLEVKWHRPQGPTAQSGEHPATTPPLAGAVARRTRRRNIALVAAGALVVAVHLGLGGAVLAAAPWTGLAANLVVVALLVKLLAVGFLAARRRRARSSSLQHQAPHDLEAREKETHRRTPHHPPFGLATHAASSAGHLGAVRGFLRGGGRENPVSQQAMVRSEARVPTPRGERYAKQLCSHAARMTPRAEWSPPAGVIEFPDSAGICRMTAEPDQLVLTLEATDSANLARLQQIVGGNIERFANREGLTVEWVQG
jgi:hypothetical protein